MKKKIVKIVFAVFIILFLIIQIYPVIWLFIASVKPSVELASAPFALPKSVTFENFVKVLSDGKIGTYMWNSLKVTGISLLLIVVLSATAGYALSKFKVRGDEEDLFFLYLRHYGSRTDHADSSVHFLQRHGNLKYQFFADPSTSRIRASAFGHDVRKLL